MKRLTFLLVVLSTVLSTNLSTFAQAPYQDCHIVYKDIPHFHYYGRQVQQRTDAANLDTLTCVYDGTFAYDTLRRHFVGYDGSSWKELAWGGDKDTSITIGTASVLTLYSTPVTIVDAPGAGYAIEVLSVIFQIDYGLSSYSGNYDLEIKCSGATNAQFSGEVLWMAMDGQKFLSREEAFGPSQTQILENASLVATVATGNPSTGDSDITIYVRYRIISI